MKRVLQWASNVVGEGEGETKQKGRRGGEEEG